MLGRDDDVAAVANLVRGAALVTLVGPGGVGKTRLAAAVVGERPDACFVDLGAVTRPEHVVPAIADAAGVVEPRLGWTADRLAIALAAQERLIVLDNCEHVISAAGEAATALTSRGSTRVLATSRKPLNVAREVTYLVGGLSRADAAALFRQRAAGVDADDDVVERVCAGLEGLPLAIELAAARAETMGGRELADRIDARPEIVRGLGAVLEWSWTILSEKEQAALARLTVFRGGATLDAAEAVLGAPPVSPDAVVDILETLVAASLVVRDRSPGPTRYRLLETIRPFAATHMSVDDRDATHERHARWAASTTRRVAAGAATAERGAWLAVARAEHDNVRSALEWSVDTGCGDMALAVANPLARIWVTTGRLAEGRSWFERIVLLPHDDVCANAMAQVHLGALQYAAGDQATAQSTFERALAGAERSACADAAARARLELGAARCRAGDRSAGVTLLHQAHQEFRSLRSLAGAAAALVALGNAEPDEALALTHLADAVALFRQLGDIANVANTLNSIGATERQRGNLDEAEAAFVEALELARRAGDEAKVALVDGNLGTIASDRWELDRAVVHFRAAYEQYRVLGGLRGAARNLTNLALGHRLRGDLPTARAMLAEALGWWRSSGDAEGVAYTLNQLGCIDLDDGRLDDAEQWLTEAGDVAASTGLSGLAATVAVNTARLSLRRGRPRDSRVRLVGLLADVAGRPLETAEALAALAEVAEAEGDAAALADCARQAGKAYVRLGSTGNVARMVLAASTAELLAGDGRRSAHLLGAAVTLAEDAGAPPPAVDAQLARARDLVGAAADAAFAAGRAADTAAVIDELFGDGAPTTALRRGRLVKEGEWWTVSFAGETTRLRDTKGLQYLARLVARQGHEIHVLDLASHADAPRQSGIPVVDRAAAESYRRRLADLDSEIDEAEQWNDDERAARAASERDRLLAELSAAYGIRGARSSADDSERARKAVGLRIRDARRKLAAELPPLARHLDHTLHTGVFCSYRPEQPVDWEVTA